ncbi:MAG: AI-2E family transporter [Pseudomonadota bacterium]|nr:AI-2E family transporter [Pseudomonadota bacterium]
MTDGEMPQPPVPSLTRTAFTVTAVVIITVLLVLVLWQAMEVLLLMFAALLIAVLLRFLSGNISRRTPLNDTWALTLVLALLLAFFGGSAWMVGPDVIAEFQALAAGLSESIRGLEEILRRNIVGAWALDNMPRFNPEQAQELWSRIAGIGATVIGAITAFVIVLFVGVFFAYNPKLYVEGSMRLVPKARRARAAEVMDKVGETLRWWLLGQVISMMVLWLSTWLVLHLLGVPLAFILGLLTGLLTFIPYLGPLIALIPIAMVSFVHSPATGLMAVGAFLVIQNLEGNLLMPIIFEKTVSLPSALTVVSQILMASLMGMLGVLLATPLLAVGMVLVRMLYVEDTLGDSLEQPLAHEPHLRGEDDPQTETNA